MITRFLRPLYYGAILWIPQLSVAQDQPPEPQPAAMEIVVHGAYCGPPGFGIAKRPDGYLALFNDDGALVDVPLKGKQTNDQAIAEAWVQRCPKQGDAR